MLADASGRKGITHICHSTSTLRAAFSIKIYCGAQSLVSCLRGRAQRQREVAYSCLPTHACSRLSAALVRVRGEVTPWSFGTALLIRLRVQGSRRDDGEDKQHGGDDGDTKAAEQDVMRPRGEDRREQTFEPQSSCKRPRMLARGGVPALDADVTLRDYMPCACGCHVRRLAEDEAVEWEFSYVTLRKG